MSFVTLCALYLMVGASCALAIWMRAAGSTAPTRTRAVRAAMAVPLWPLWAPIVLSDPTIAESTPSDASLPVRIEDALREGVEVARGTALDALLNPASAARITEMVRRAKGRRGELQQLLSRPEFCLQRARARVCDAEHDDRPRSLATARLHLDNVERLHALAAQDEVWMVEIADMTEALRTQLLMARYAGSSGDGIGDIIGDLWARVEALSEAMDCNAAAEPQTRVDGNGAAHGAASDDGSNQHGLTPHPGRG